MHKLSERGVVHLLVPLILLIGIIAGVYLVSTGNLKLFSRASNPPIVFVSSTSQAITTTTSPSVKIELTSSLGAPVFATPTPSASPTPPITSPTPTPIGIGTTNPIGIGTSGRTLGVGTSAPVQISGTVSYRLAENPTDLNKASFTPYIQHPTVLDYTFKDAAPGAKFIWADFKDVTGITDRKTAQIELVSPTSSPSPSPTPFACTACNSDVKKDGYVNGGDVSYLIGCYNKLSTDKDRSGKSCADRDIYPDGVIDGREFSCIRTVFNQQCQASPTPSPVTNDATRTIRVWVLDHHEPNYYHPYIQPDPVTWTRDKLLPALNEASKYHGYSNPSAQPALNYTLFDYKQVNDTTDPILKDVSGNYDHDGSLFKRYDLCNYAKANDIKVVMVWGVGRWESIITGSRGVPTNGAIMSNLCPDKTIVIYSLNYERELDEAMEAVGHHYEAVFRKYRPEYASWSGEDVPYNPDFCPPDGSTKNDKCGRGNSCGTVHNPPNARCPYDRSNPDGWLECGSATAPASVMSDCKNWKPDGSGIKEPLDCNAWNCRTKGDDAWITWWMQNMPGIGNNLVGTDGQKIPNWWAYIGDPDSIIPQPSARPTPSPSPSALPASTAYSRVFVTSTFYNGNLGGLAGADAKCQARANAANLGGSWKAWLSGTSISAASRLNHSSGPYKLLDGTTIADNWTDLTDGTLQNPVSITEYVRQINLSSWLGRAWTNTNETGDVNNIEWARTYHCNEWTANSDGLGNIGSTQVKTFQWTRRESTFCSSPSYLYCFEQ